ncbi:cupin domain-containing protein [Bacillus sp. B1-b2]|uniref:cupin domain-containing protein n=1 Tax=Bacillus sp. B1-b2 TaxID=2653201 RepID=UPI0012618184|nr:cupin domain-containing protein [Bacillus sp. B1-b2]KAB7672069.1 cupin domain-containing protein [Bacillus sp. B1-b2]
MGTTTLIKKLPHSEVFRLEDMVLVDANQVSSMTIVQKPSIGITLFSLGKGEGIKMHTSPGDAMVQILSGKAEIMIGEDKYTVQVGETIILPADIPHSLQAVESFQMLLIVVKPDKE